MKTITLILLLTLSACATTKTPSAEEYSKKHHSYSPPKWMVVDDHAEYCDSNVCAMSVIKFRQEYNILEAQAGF